MDETTLFKFESDFVESLRCIPMAVRFKLDVVGIKLSLREWSRLSQADRRALLFAPCSTSHAADAYRKTIVTLLLTQGQEATAPLPPGSTVEWGGRSHTPEQISTFALENGVDAPSDAAWGGLTDLQRFVLLKLSRDNHDNINFLPALREFGLLQTNR